MRRVLALAGVVGLAASSTAFSPSGVAGTYTLKSVNGNPVPYTQDLADWGTAEVKEGTLTLREDETWLLSVTVTRESEIWTINGSGTFTLVPPNTIRFTDSSDGSLFEGTIDGGTVTVVQDGESSTFEKK